MCPCNITACLDVEIGPCATAVILPVTAPVSGVYRVSTDFNGYRLNGDTEAVQGERIAIPTNILNGNYTHTLRIFRPDGTLLNNTCYNLTTMASIYAGTLPSASYLAVSLTLTEAMIGGSYGTSFTWAGLGTKTVISIAIDLTSPNRENFTQSGTTITRTDGGGFSAGQVVALHFGTVVPDETVSG